MEKIFKCRWKYLILLFILLQHIKTIFKFYSNTCRPKVSCNIYSKKMFEYWYSNTLQHWEGTSNYKNYKTVIFRTGINGWAFSFLITTFINYK